MKGLSLILACMLVAASPTAEASNTPWPIALRQSAARLMDVGFRIGRTAAPLCPATAAGTGIALDYIEAYETTDRPAVSRLLNLKSVPQVAAVAADSPAMTAGVRPGDAVLAINGVSAESLRRESPNPSLFADQLEDRLARMPAQQPIVLQLERDGQPLDIKFTPVPICAARYVIKAQSAVSAYTDGRNIATTSGLIDYTRSDAELALVLGHEAGHVIHGDGDRDGAGRAERRAMEDRADTISLRLVKCAGYDVEAALQYRLRRAAARPLEGLFQGDHRPSRARALRLSKLAPFVTCPPSA